MSRRAEFLYYRATIAARLGDRDEAIRLLQEARSTIVEGDPGYWWAHRDPDLAPLHGYPPFEALYQPKD